VDVLAGGGQPFSLAAAAFLATAFFALRLPRGERSAEQAGEGGTEWF
jgi:hypothetical protein